MDLIDKYNAQMGNLYYCPHCRKSSSMKNWNDTTEKDFGGSIYPICEEDTAITNDCDYTCPKCNWTHNFKYIWRTTREKAGTS